MIDRDEQLSPEQKERNRDSVREVIRYCSNRVDCRRTQVLRFFDEAFDPKECAMNCDVCINGDKQQIEKRDVSTIVIKAIKMIQAMGPEDRMTMPQAIACFRGVRGKGDNNPHHGCGRDVPISDVERIFEHMAIEQLLGENIMVNGAGYSTSYLKVSSASSYGSDTR